MTNVLWRYLLAIALTSLLMIWQSGDAVRRGADFSDQATFWVASVTVGWLQMILISRGVRASFGVDRWSGWGLLIISALIGALPLTFQVRWMMQTIVAPESGLPAVWVTYLNVTTICTVFSLIQYLLIEQWPLRRATQTDPNGPSSGSGAEQSLATGPEQANSHEHATPANPSIDLLSRRPDSLQGTIKYLRMDDHYLHVHTDAGNGMILHRMSDAVSELARADGLQVHKSWWVARACVQDIRRENRRRFILSDDGQKIPIGRSFEKVLREAGWY